MFPSRSGTEPRNAPIAQKRENSRAVPAAGRRRFLFAGSVLSLAGCGDSLGLIADEVAAADVAAGSPATFVETEAPASVPAASVSGKPTPTSAPPAPPAAAPTVPADTVAVQPRSQPTTDIISRAVNYTGQGTSFAESAPPRFTDANRPSPESMPHQVIYNASVQRHQVSTGTKWMNLPSNAPIEAVPVVTQASRPSASSMPGEYVLVSDLNGGTYQRSNGSAWTSVGRDYIAVIESLLGVTVAGKALPAPTAGFVASRKVYVDPTAAAGGAGTLASPYNGLSGVSLTPGTEVLIRRDTTLRGALAIAGVRGGAASPVVVGVYDPASGARVGNGEKGTATIDAAGAAVGIAVNDSSHVCIDGLRVVNVGGAAGIRVSGGSDVQILNCVTDRLPQRGIVVFQASSITVDACQANENGSDGIGIEAGSGTLTGIRVYRCTANGNRSHGIRWAPFGPGVLLADSEFGGNIARFHVSGTDGGSGYGFRAGNMRDVLIYRNDFSDNRYIGLGLQGWLPYPANAWSNVKVVSNEANRCGMGIHLITVQAPSLGSVTIEHNRCNEAGSRDGGRTPADPSHYGRGIEIYGQSQELRSSNIVVRFNSCCRAYVWDKWLTEGVGIGFDDYSAWCSAYFNLTAENEGHGIQNNRTFAIRRFGNIVIDNARLAQGARNIYPDPAWLNALRANVHRSPRCDGALDYLNVVVSGRGFYQKYGFADHLGEGGAPPLRGKVHNNVLVNVADAGILKADATEVGHNRFVNTPTPMRSSSTYASIAPGSSDTVSTLASVPTSAAAQLAAASKTVYGWIPHYTLL